MHFRLGSNRISGHECWRGPIVRAAPVLGRECSRPVTHKLFQGTHQGTFMGIAPTGRQIAFAVIDILRLENGKVVEHWAIQDRLALMQQLGMLPVQE